jgi:carbon-monoxide dehydrogenase medium subunit
MSFELVEPTTLDEALGYLDPDDASIRAVSGGTALSLMLQSRIFQPQRLVSLRRIQGDVRGVRVASDGSLEIGALTTLSELERSPVVALTVPVVHDALHALSNVRIRNVATVGGHLAHADPHMDLPPILITLGAFVRVASLRGERTIAIADLIVGYYETALAADELITALVIPAQPLGVRAAYAKFTALSADDWPAVGAAVWVRRENGAIAEARVAIGSATERPVRVAAAEALLVGAHDHTRNADAADIVADGIDPLADLRGSAAYKREMVRVFVRRALAQVGTEERS